MRLSPLYIIIFFLLLSSCELKIKPFEDEEEKIEIEVCRYDRLESLYLTTGDFSALQQMNTDYPIQTRTLLENILRLGEVNDLEINKRFLTFFQDTTLQDLISDAEAEYANMDDINKSLSKAFNWLRKNIPEIPIPQIYAQITALDQSIVIGEQSIGISLDKYLGEDYPLYKRYNYSEAQLSSMTRKNIVPDCINFYLLSLYPLSDFESRSQLERDLHLSKVMWVCNNALDDDVLESKYIDLIDDYMSNNKDVDIDALLRNNDSSVFPVKENESQDTDQVAIPKRINFR